MKRLLSCSFLLQIAVSLLLVLLFGNKSKGSAIRVDVDALPPSISPSTQPQPFIPLIAPSPLRPFINNSVPKLSDMVYFSFPASQRHCSLNFSAAQDIMTTTATDCRASFAPYLANVVCCPQFDAVLVTLIGQPSKYSGVLALNTTHARHCLSDVQKVLASQGANGDLKNICLIHSTNLTEASCPVVFVDEFESIVDTSRLLTACRKIDPVNECCDKVCQNAIHYAARKIALNDLSNSDGNHSLPGPTARIDDCKNIVLRWLGSKLDPSTVNSVCRVFSNCKLNQGVVKECGNLINNQTACCKAIKSYVSYLQEQSFVTNLQALKCATLLGKKLLDANVSENVYSLCHITLKDFSLQESSCLLPSLPSNAVFDGTSGIGFICDLNDNIVAPWPTTSYPLPSSCNRTTKPPSLPTTTSSQNGLFINTLVLPLLFTSILLPNWLL